MTTTLAPPLYRTSIGKKLLMAGSGVILVGFIVFHMLGNLKVFLGAGPINKYGEGLRTLGEPILPRTYLLWLVRAVLISAFAIHIITAVQLAMQSRAARTTRYVHTDTVQADYAAKTMRWGGLTIGLFLVFHLAHFTWGWVHPGYTYVRGDVYDNLVQGFKVWWISAIYLLAMVALGLHIYHGTWSVFQTFGVNSRRWDRAIRRGATTVASVVVIGNSSIPIAVLAGAVK
jgi:succinate dehydrogenase / fumarate reductase cytochrome b subunit